MANNSYSIGSLFVSLGLDDKALKSGAAGASTTMQSLGQQAAVTALGFIGANGLMGAFSTLKNVMVNSVKEFVEFQKAMAEVSTLVDTSKVDMKELSEGVMQLSIAFGQEEKGLAKALYQTLSAGVPAGKAIEFLGVAGKAAIGGVTDTFTAVNALTSGLNAYGMTSDKAIDISDALFQTIKAGKTTMAELAPAIGTVAPLAANAGVSFDEMSAAMATLTLSGIDTSTAATALRAIMSSMIKPSNEAAQAAKMLGLEWNASALKSKGLKGSLDALFKATQGDTEALGVMIPEIRALNGALILGGTGAEKFGEIMGMMEEKSGATNVAFGKMQDTLSFKWDQVTLKFKDMGKSVAEDLEPALRGVVAVLGYMADGFTFFGKTFTAVIEGIAKMINGFDGFERKAMSNEEQVTKYTVKLKALNDMMKAAQETAAAAPQEDKKKADERVAAIQQEIKNTEFMIKGFEARIAKEKGVGAAAKDTAKVVDDATQKQLDAQKKIIEAMKKKLNANKDEQNAQEQFQTKATSMANELLKLEEQNTDRKNELAKKASEVRFGLLEAQKNAEIETFDAIANDEKATNDQRLEAAQQASQKRIELLGIQRDAALQAAKDELVIDANKYEGLINVAEQKLSELDKIYKDENGKIRAGYEKEYEGKKDSLDNIITDTETSLDKVFDTYQVTSKKINSEFDTSVTKETTALYKINYDINASTFDKLMANVKMNYDKWASDLEQGSTAAWSGLVTDSASAVKAIGSMFGGLPNEVSPYIDGMVNVITSALSGNPIQTAASIFGLIGTAIMGTGDKSKMAAEEERKAAEQAYSAAKAFLKSQGKYDLSLMSASEIMDTMGETVAEAVKVFSTNSAQFAGMSEDNKKIAATNALLLAGRFQQGQYTTGSFTNAGMLSYNFGPMVQMRTDLQTAKNDQTILEKYGSDVLDVYKKIQKGEITFTKGLEQIGGLVSSAQVTAGRLPTGYAAKFGEQLGAFEAATTAPGGSTTTPTSWAGVKAMIQNKVNSGQITQEEGAKQLLSWANNTNSATGKPYWYEMAPGEYQDIKNAAAAAAPALAVAQFSGATYGGYGATGYARVAPGGYAGSMDSAELYLDNWATETISKYDAGQIGANEFKTTIMSIAAKYMDLAKTTGLGAARIVELRKKATDLVSASAHVWQDIYGAANIGAGGAGGAGPGTVSVPGNTVDQTINTAEEALDEDVKVLNLKWALGKLNSKELQTEVFRIANQYRAYAKEAGISQIKSLVLQKKANDLVGAYANVWQEEYGMAHYGETGGGTNVTAGATLPSALGEQLGVKVLPGMLVGQGATGSEFINAVEQLTSGIMGAQQPLLPENMNINVTVTSGGAITDGQANTIAITIGEAIGTNMTSQGEVP